MQPYFKQSPKGLLHTTFHNHAQEKQKSQTGALDCRTFYQFRRKPWLSFAYLAGEAGGRGRIRTDERRSGRIYSPHPLATWIPYLLRNPKRLNLPRLRVLPSRNFFCRHEGRRLGQIMPVSWKLSPEELAVAVAHCKTLAGADR